MRNQTKNRQLPSGYVVRYWNGALGKVVEIPCDDRSQAITQRRELVALGHPKDGIVVADVAAGRLIDE